MKLHCNAPKKPQSFTTRPQIHIRDYEKVISCLDWREKNVSCSIFHLSVHQKSCSKWNSSASKSYFRFCVFFASLFPTTTFLIHKTFEIHNNNSSFGECVRVCAICTKNKTKNIWNLNRHNKYAKRHIKHWWRFGRKIKKFDKWKKNSKK